MTMPTLHPFIAFCHKQGLTIEPQRMLVDKDKLDDWHKTAFGWNVQLRRKGKTLTTSYWCGSAQPPSAPDVMASLLMDACSADESFEDWCSSFGYDTDSIKHKKTYDACVATAKNLKEFLGAELDAFAEASRDW